MKDLEELKANIASATAEIVEAAKVYELAVTRSQQARSAESSALNALNTAQKRFDSLTGELKKCMAYDSDWARQRRNVQPVEAP